MLKAPLRLIARLVRLLGARAMLRIAYSRAVEGLVVVNLTGIQQESELFGVVESALSKIRDTDPLRYKRILKDVPRVAVIKSHGSAGENWSEYGAVALDVDHLRKERLDAICMTIVHEATHARFQHWGVGGKIDPARIERACVNQEIIFARKLPNTESLIRGATMKLDTKWWVQTLSLQHYDSRLEAIGTPKWLRRLLVWIHR